MNILFAPLTLGPLLLAAPLALLGLLALPLLWRLLRAAPPSPKRRLFPPLRLLEDLSSDTQTQARTPWPLVVLRLGAMAIACFALARPVLNPDPGLPGTGPVLLIVDDGWAAAPRWEATLAAARAVIAEAEGAARPLALVFTAPRAEAPADLVFTSAEVALEALGDAAPAPWGPARAALATRLEAASVPPEATPIWLSDGLDAPGTDALLTVLGRLGPGRVRTPDGATEPLALRPLEAGGDGFSAEIVRAGTVGDREIAVVLLDDAGQALGRAEASFADGESLARTRLSLPAPLRGQAALARLESGPSSGGAQALDDQWRRPLVGLVAASAEADRQPLLADLHYLAAALAPHAETLRAPLADLLAARPGAIVLTDAGRIVGAEAEALADFVADGGLLLRFAGPRLAARADELTPVTLRTGGRALGGALAWDAPQPLAPFGADSPFAGLTPPADVTVSRQVLAEPAPDLASKTWARLADGTPLVTADRRGAGRIVLVHTSANPDWSSLPLSGLFPAMLGRIVRYAGVTGADGLDAAGDWRLDAALDASGRLVDPGRDPALLPDAAWTPDLAPGPDAPPGVWRRGAEARALNLTAADTVLAPLPDLPAGLLRETGGGAGAVALAGPLLALVLVLLTVDAIVLLALAGRLMRTGGGTDPARGKPARPPRAPRASGAAALLAGVLLGLAGVGGLYTGPATAADEVEERWALDALDGFRLAYVRTGSASVDRISRDGLVGLSRQLERRTSVAPGAPVALDLGRDPFELFPLIYWPVGRDAVAPSPEVAARIDAYLKSGGVIVFDTQDAATAALDLGAPHPGLARIVEAIDIPPLSQTPAEHVLTKAFYLLDTFPGRWDGAPVWVEADARGSARDGVSSVIVTSADWAGAWATDASGRPLAAVTPGGERQRELSYRVGVNLVMYVLTGNYKADQVHVPALLERLGQ